MMMHIYFLHNDLWTKQLAAKFVFNAITQLVLWSLKFYPCCWKTGVIYLTWGNVHWNHPRATCTLYINLQITGQINVTNAVL